MQQQCQNPADGLYRPTSSGTPLHDILNVNVQNNNTPDDKNIQNTNTNTNANTNSNENNEQHNVNKNKNNIVSNDNVSDEHNLIETLQRELYKKNKCQCNKNVSCKKMSKAGILLEPLILLTIYVVLSQTNVIAFFSEYVGQLQPGSDNLIPLSGIIIYGVIMVFLFLVARQVIYIYC